MADITRRIPGCDDCDDCEDGERGKRGKRGKRGHRGHDGHDGKDGQDGHDGATGAPGPALFQFSGTVSAETPLLPPGSNFADGGAVSIAFPDTLLTGGPFPAYPLAQAQTISALAVNVFASVPITAGTISFQLVTVPDDASAPETPIGSPVSFVGLVLGNNTDRVLFAPVVLNPGVRLALRVSSGGGFIVGANLLVAATAG
jgi:hypothetical protein